MVYHLRVLLISMGLFLVGGPQWAAVADEIFICDGNKVVRVARTKLAHMKRTNACVAAHFGLKVKARAKTHAGTPKFRAHKLISGPKRAKRPSKQAKTAARPSRSRSTKTAQAKAKRTRTSAKVSQSELKVYRKDDVLPVEEIAAEPSDYRNVRVLNAKSKPAKWHRHSF